MDKTIQILSPDGIPISHEAFATKKKALDFYQAWAKRFEAQGYYSSNERKIELKHLDRYCELGTVDPNNGDHSFRPVFSVNIALAMEVYLALP